MHTAGGNLDYGTGGDIGLDIELMNGTVQNEVRFEQSLVLSEIQKLTSFPIDMKLSLTGRTKIVYCQKSYKITLEKD